MKWPSRLLRMDDVAYRYAYMKIVFYPCLTNIDAALKRLPAYQLTFSYIIIYLSTCPSIYLYYRPIIDNKKTDYVSWFLIFYKEKSWKR